MIFSSASAAATVAFPQNTAEATTNPLVEFHIHIPVIAVLEVTKPAAERQVQLSDHAFQGIPIRALGFTADSIFQLLDAFLTRPVFLARNS